jgi:hypothetical protein
MESKTLLSALAVLPLALGLEASPAGAAPPVGSPEGTWVGTSVVTNPPGLPAFPSTDIYTASRRNPTMAGTVLCTIPGTGRFPIFVNGQPAYFVKTLPTGSGSWMRVGRNRFAFTVWRILLDADTEVVAGTAKHWGVVTLLSRNELSGAVKAQYFGLDGLPITPVLEGTVSETRVAVEVETAGADSTDPSEEP